MCFSADWKREEVPEHKWDFVNVREFHKGDFFTRFKYMFVYLFLLKSFAVYCLDIFTAITMIASGTWVNAIQGKCGEDCIVPIPYNVAKWIFVGCIIFSFLLLAYESYKTRRIILSRDISYSYTNIMANDYYSLRNYDNFCFFCAISKSTKMHDEFAFFIFFTFKSWKRLILADGPRQAINAIILFSFAKANNFQTSNLSVYWDNSVITLLLLLAMLATLLIFICSFVLLIVAAVGYVPLLCYIQGNLKEYVCHKVDKRIAHLIKKKGVERAKRAADLEKQQGRPTKNGESKQGLPQPTLSSFVIEDDKHFQPRKQQVSGPGHVGSRPGLMPTSNSQQSLDPNHQYWNQNHTAAAAEYSHNDYGYPPQPQPLYANDSYGSTTHLTEAAANPGFAYPDPRVAYPGIAYVENPTLPRALSPTPPLPFHSSPYWSHEQEQQQYRDSSQAVAPPTHRQRQGSYDSYNPPSQSQSNLPLTQTNLYLASRDRYQLSHSPMYSADLRSSAQPANYEGGLGAIPQVDPDFFYDQAAAPAYAAHGSHQQSQDEKAIYKPSSSSRNDGQDFSRSMFRSGSGPGGNESREGSSLAYNRQ